MAPLEPGKDGEAIICCFRVYLKSNLRWVPQVPCFQLKPYLTNQMLVCQLQSQSHNTSLVNIPTLYLF